MFIKPCVHLLDTVKMESLSVFIFIACLIYLALQ